MINFILRLLLLACSILLSNIAVADELRPAYLQLDSIDDLNYAVKWKVPKKGGQTLTITPIFSTNCQTNTTKRSYSSNNTETQQWSIVCPQGLAGKTLIIKGLENTAVEVLIRLAGKDNNSQIMRLNPRKTELVLTAKASNLAIVKVYTGLGIEHILIGVDHLLFVLALLLIVTGWRQLVATITAFTLAHSITLAIATLNIVSLPIAVVEAVIALSIVFLATEIIHEQHGKTGLTKRMPWLIAFLFGLLHGFGFASALAQVGLPEHGIPLALLFFNVGVEIGQLLFVATISGIVWLLRHFINNTYRQYGKLVITYAIGSIATFWFFQRIVLF